MLWVLITITTLRLFEWVLAKKFCTVFPAIGHLSLRKIDSDQTDHSQIVSHFYNQPYFPEEFPAQVFKVPPFF